MGTPRRLEAGKEAALPSAKPLQSLGGRQDFERSLEYRLRTKRFPSETIQCTIEATVTGGPSCSPWMVAYPSSSSFGLLPAAFRLRPALCRSSRHTYRPYPGNTGPDGGRRGTGSDHPIPALSHLAGYRTPSGRADPSAGGLGRLHDRSGTGSTGCFRRSRVLRLQQRGPATEAAVILDLIAET